MSSSNVGSVRGRNVRNGEYAVVEIGVDRRVIQVIVDDGDDGLPVRVNVTVASAETLAQAIKSAAKVAGKNR